MKIKRTMRMRTVGFWVFLLLYIASATYVTFEHDDDMDFAISMTMALCSFVGFLVAFFPQKKQKENTILKLNTQPLQKTTVRLNEVLQEKDFDLKITKVSFIEGVREVCCICFLSESFNDERRVIFYREKYPYIYDQLYMLKDRNVFPLMATISYDKKENTYYFKNEI